MLDEQYKTVYIQRGKTAQITWENTPATGQIQITRGLVFIVVVLRFFDYLFN